MSVLPPASAEGPSFLFLEAGITLVFAGLALCMARSSQRPSQIVAGAFARLARRQWLSVLVVGCAAFALRASLLPFLPIPKPFITDDFSFLLAAETFAAGRLTNPPHLMWTHFDSFHITYLPTYMSMYFPAQGLVLAAGQLIAGNPWFGVLFSVACMSAAFCWMFQAWLPPRWALLGGFITVLHLGVFSYWINSYTGGAIAASGGALVMGALPRIWRRFRAPDFLWMAVGMALLANSRPYEGLLVCVPAVLILCVKLHRAPHPSLPILLRRCIPAALLLAGTLAFMGYYNHRVFGNVFTPPYQVSRAAYAVAPYFLWQQPRPEPAYRHKEVRDFYAGWELDWFKKSRSPQGFLVLAATKLLNIQLFYLGFALLPPLLLLPRALKDRRMRPLVFIAAVFVPGLAIETFFMPHYMAPFAAAFYVLVLQCMRHLRMCRLNGRLVGDFFVRAVPAVCVLLCVLRFYAQPLHLYLSPDTASARAWFGTQPLGLDRDRVLSDLERLPGQQLALVRYSPRHDVVDEWVYNSADIDGSRVVWARDMKPAENETLLHYFSGRKVWLVEPDAHPPKASEYRPAIDAGNELLSTTRPAPGNSLVHPKSNEK